MKYSVNVKKDGKIIKSISCVLRGEQIGNFNPFFCTYKGKRKLVESEAGDLSDPFRRKESYATSLFITE